MRLKLSKVDPSRLLKKDATNADKVKYRIELFAVDKLMNWVDRLEIDNEVLVS